MRALKPYDPRLKVTPPGFLPPSRGYGAAGGCARDNGWSVQQWLQLLPHRVGNYFLTSGRRVNLVSLIQVAIAADSF